ncbi:MAG: hypothetical protein LC800_04665 [Acidobacteria bacterium]|nr:hypothetical protein [Acidobacteriota bacterium]
MEDILLNWKLAALPTLLNLAVGFAGTRRLETVLNRLGAAIRTRSDLAALRAAINLNMALALLLALIYGLYLAALLFHLFTARILLPTFVVYNALMPLAGALCTRLYFRRVEERAQNLSISSPDPEIEADYRRWLKQWREPRLRLS